ncbi:metalloregulator ArsR/SmtB family transcription factor [Hydrogenoanaerobacterium sp.]|uniref:ArsR/SmtB family transcription factor n=1 Tax=Hydrogenoanaerobacterium sp. TaxID=2953763 RepID=UPI00289C8FD5|nr:metalloregulator ArsR/SmtB family transcription factor [Hydrogenoanaerobacterium sp.]
MVDVLKALADETRLRILAQIMKGDMCVCEIEACLGLTQSNASRHLTTLKKAGVLESYKNAQWTYYKIDKSFVTENLDLFTYLETKLKNMPCYTNDCENYCRCKQQNLCN